MSVTVLIVVLVGIVAAMLVLMKLLDVIEKVRVARWNAMDPRFDDNAVAAAAKQVRRSNDGRDSIGGT